LHGHEALRRRWTVESAELRHILVGQNPDYVRFANGFSGIDAGNASGGNGCSNEDGTKQPRGSIIGGITRGASDLGRSVRSGERLTDAHGDVLAAAWMAGRTAVFAGGNF